MKVAKSLVLGSVAGLLAIASCHAAESRFRKAARNVQVEKSTACDAYGQGFVRVGGTSACVKIGGSVTYDYTYKVGH